jgi:hypothetical protein
MDQSWSSFDVSRTFDGSVVVYLDLLHQFLGLVCLTSADTHTFQLFDMFSLRISSTSSSAIP